MGRGHGGSWGAWNLPSWTGWWLRGLRLRKCILEGLFSTPRVFHSISENYRGNHQEGYLMQ